MSFSTDLQRSIETAQKFIKPILKKMFGEKAIVESVETEDSIIARFVDSAGIDFVVKNPVCLIGINSRCHKERAEKTFTIRENRHGADAEFKRIRAAMERGGIYPEYFIQCYVAGDHVTVGIIKTKNLFRYIEDHGANLFHNGDVEFLSVKWRDLKNARVSMLVCQVDVATGEIKKIA